MDLDEVARSALAIDGIESAVIFVVRPGSHDLELAAAAGIEGSALVGLTAAVRNPAHPIAKALTDEGPTFDVQPMNPGGPALRSHLPIAELRDGRRTVVGVLALAHDQSLNADARRRLEDLVAGAQT